MKEFIFDLQLFADENTQTTTLDFSGNDLSPEMRTFYSRNLLESAKANLVHTQFGERRPLPAGGGKVIQWRKWSAFPKALTPLTEGVTPDGTPVNVGSVSAQIRQYGDYTTVSDLLELTAIDNVITEISSKHGENAGLTIDTLVRNELNCGTQVIYAPKYVEGSETAVSYRHALDKTAVLTPEVIAKAVTQLKKNNAPKFDGSYVCIIHPSVAHDLITNYDWIDVQKYANVDSILSGEIGKLYGVRFVESTEAKIFYGANLKGSTRNLSVHAYSSRVVTVKETLSVAEAAALVGREVIIDGVHYEIVSATASASANTATFTVKSAPASGYPAQNDIICPGEGGAVYTDSDSVTQTYAAYSCLFLGKGAYNIVDLEGGGLETIVKQKGSAGTADPLNQRSTIGWKCAGFAAKAVIPEYIVRVECGSSYSDSDTAN